MKQKIMPAIYLILLLTLMLLPAGCARPDHAEGLKQTSLPAFASDSVRATEGAVSGAGQEAETSSAGADNDRGELPRVGMRASKEQIARWLIMGMDRSVLSEPNKTYPYASNKYAYISADKIWYIWLDENRIVIKVEAANELKRTQKPSETSKYRPGTFKVYEPEVEGFSNSEDFYDYYYDDFADYWDAENYYYEHGGE